MAQQTDILKRIKNILTIIYSTEVADRFLKDLKNLMDLYSKNEIIIEKRNKYKDRVLLNEKDTILITYPDTIYKKGEKSLNTLLYFLKRYIKDSISGLHILPFFPSSSDGGYAVIDYKEVDPTFGTWDDIQKIAKEYRLMVDCVMNHVSSKSKWFQAFLHGDKRFRDYFIWYDNEIDMPTVFRPRETPLLTKFETAMGIKYLWTTFSPDQIDLNYKNPEVLLRIIDIFLFYLSQGAEIIRLDAVGYIWKEPHTSCVNLVKTHQIVKLFRGILEYTAPYALIVTEANFPYKENIAYFGEGDETNMVYNFSLPPLVVDAFARKDTSYIREETKRTREDLLFFDVLATHDGIALLSAKSILKKSDFENLLKITKAHNGLISYKATPNGKEPYELNISYFDAINDPNKIDDPFIVKRFIASQAIMLTLKGLPGIYIHSLLGSRNYYKGVEETKIKRMINREKLKMELIEASLSDVHSLRYQVLNNYLHLLNVRKEILAFSPLGSRKLIESDKRLLVILREYQGESVLTIINVSNDTLMLPEYKDKNDLITNRSFDGKVEPYGVYFLK